MEKYFDILTPILIQSIMTLAVIAALMGMITSLWLLLSPSTFLRFEEKASRTVSLRQTLRPLEISRNIDRHIYRYHKAFGLFVILASTYTVYHLLFDLIPESRPNPLIPPQTAILFWDWLLDGINVFLVLGNLFSLTLGFIIFTRPSALKGFEAKANQWLSLRQQTVWLDRNLSFPDQLAQRKPRLLGVVIFVFTLYLIALLTVNYDTIRALT